jgi:tripartite-type tricarboxylate transporter receptor subunit TctC
VIHASSLAVSREHRRAKTDRPPRDIISKLNGAAVEALADPAVGSRLADLGLEIFPREQQTPEALAALQKADAEKWWPIIKELGIKAQ